MMMDIVPIKAEWERLRIVLQENEREMVMIVGSIESNKDYNEKST